MVLFLVWFLPKLRLKDNCFVHCLTPFLMLAYIDQLIESHFVIFIENQSTSSSCGRPWFDGTYMVWGVSSPPSVPHVRICALRWAPRHAWPIQGWQCIFDQPASVDNLIWNTNHHLKRHLHQFKVKETPTSIW